MAAGCFSEGGGVIRQILEWDSTCHIVTVIAVLVIRQSTTFMHCLDRIRFPSSMTNINLEQRSILVRCQFAIQIVAEAI
jgi:hypothetical protein